MDNKTPTIQIPKPTDKPKAGDVVFNLERFRFTKKSTIGKWYEDGKEGSLLYTIERPYGDGKNKRDDKSTPNINESLCILPGIYPITIEFSPSLKQQTPRLHNVPNRDGILIHPANWANQLLGCIAPGKSYSEDAVQNSTVAYGIILQTIRSYIMSGKQVWVKISNKPEMM